jgi:linoleoyl-CoA desaturase
MYKIHDKLYDLTDFIKIHPGGQDMFNHLKTNTNITPMLYSYHKNPKNILTMILPKYEVPMSTDIIKFDTNYTYDKYCELKKLVYDEIREKKIPLYWSYKEIAYNAFMLSLYFGLWVYCFWNASNLSYWWMVLLALMNTGICNLIFHETSHHSGFKNQTINNCLTMCIYPLMTDSYWKYNHNFLHHSFTNTVHDVDFVFPPNSIIRHSNKQKYSWYYKYQSLYSLFLFQLVFLHKGVVLSLLGRTLNWTCFPVLLYIFGVYKTLSWYLLSGIIFVFIAQLSHIQHECIEMNTENKNDFLYNQVSSSMNYKLYNSVTKFICFSLDIQIEHHLFPNIPHSSLRKIQHVVRDYCDKNDIPYIEKSSIFSSIYSYICYLYKMGNP